MPEIDLIKKYKEKIASELGTIEPTQFVSREYEIFKKEEFPKTLSLYEKLARFAGKILKQKLKPEKEKELVEYISIAHLDISPSDSLAFAYFYPILLILFGALIGFLLGSTFLALFIIVLALGAMSFATGLPKYFASKWRMRSSSQMILCIFYLVTYMRHTSNLERAIAFAAEHLPAPLGLDMRWILWAAESRKFETVHEALDFYLKGWRAFSPEFVDAIRLIESSLYEPTEERRLGLLDKGLDVMLEGTYERMLHFAQGLKSPLTALHMLGIVLPILGLVILPLAVSFMEEVKWWHIGLIYNIALPIVVYFMGQSILVKRPSGYGELPIDATNPRLKKYRNLFIGIGPIKFYLTPLFFAIFVGIVFFLIGLFPLILRVINPSFDICFPACEKGAVFELLGYRESTREPGKFLGPYGLGATIFSFAFPLAAALGFGIFYRISTKGLMKLREAAKKMEDEFGAALFQLSSRLADGIPLELAFEKVAAVVGESSVGDFFRITVNNMRKLGLGIKDAIFDPKVGAVVYYPSAIIHSSMKVLIDAIKKGPLIASQAIGNVSRYIREIHRVDERLKDLMAEIISDMKSQIAFLTPMIAGIVIGITSMITYILSNLTRQLKNVGQLGADTLNTAASGTGPLSGILSLFGESIPTYYFQAVVGLYVVEIIFLLTIIASSIENGVDKLMEDHLLGKNLIASTFTYVFVALIVVIIFNFIAAKIISGAVMSA